MPSRISEYEDLIIFFLQEGYEIISVLNYYQRLIKNHIKESDKIIINRHDIDTSKETAKKIFEIEKKYHVFSSFYFRLKTLDINLMKEVNTYGSEVGYHFEELATYAKRHNIKNKKKLISDLKHIQSEFKDNFINIEKKIGFKIKSVASHGDFANRKINLTNHPVTDNIELRKNLGIEFEVYDKIINYSFDMYISDRLPPKKYHPINPHEAVKRKNNIICMLTHPRKWQSDFLSNSRENITRLAECIIWSVSR